MHPTLYSLQWFNQWSEITISKQAFIAFSSGPYCAGVLCDVLPMDACYLLLDRPWLFDNHVIYDGHTNTDAFKHKGQNVILTPLPPPKPLKSKLGKESEKNQFMVETSMEGAIRKNKPLFSLIMV